MLGIFKQKNSKDNQIKMDFNSWAVHYKLAKFKQTLNAFEILTIHFCQIAQKMKNPKNGDYKQALQTFHNRYYHEFLYHNTHRTTECRNFIKCLAEFEQNKKPKKSEYVELFNRLQTFQKKQLPGGHHNKTPFMFTDQAIQKWFHDEVGNTKNSDHKHEMYKNGIWTGHTDCPANYQSKPDKKHLLHIELNDPIQKTLLKLNKHNIQMHKDLFAHMEDEDPYKSIQMEYLQRSHERVHDLNERYQQLQHNYEQLYEQNRELENMFRLNHRQFDEINRLRHGNRQSQFDREYKRVRYA